MSKRVGKAVDRNRVKRLLREATGARLGLVVPGHDLVFIARRPVAGAEYREVDLAVEHLLTLAGLLRA